MLQIQILILIITRPAHREWKHQQSNDITCLKYFIRCLAILGKDTVALECFSGNGDIEETVAWEKMRGKCLTLALFSSDLCLTPRVGHRTQSQITHRSGPLSSAGSAPTLRDGIGVCVCTRSWRIILGPLLCGSTLLGISGAKCCV